MRSIIKDALKLTPVCCSTGLWAELGTMEQEILTFAFPLTVDRDFPWSNIHSPTIKILSSVLPTVF
jgi:hypothetical protein